MRDIKVAYVTPMIDYIISDNECEYGDGYNIIWTIANEYKWQQSLFKTRNLIIKMVFLGVV